ESLRKLDAFIPVIVYYASKGNRKAVAGTGEYEKWRAVILGTEVVLLEALCFDVVVDHPHVALVALLERLALARTPAAQMAWSFVADCMRLPACLVYDAETLACAAVELAARVAPGSVAPGWADRAGARRADVTGAAQWLLEFYAREAQARRPPPAESAQTPASSPASNASPMPHALP
ncbi:hypothetical protein GGF43_006696, partial [Coemansia sp. RSA 2618]